MLWYTRNVKYRAIIFDWDGTLAMTLHLWLAGYREALQKQSHTIPDSIIAADFFYERDKSIHKYPGVDFERMFEDTKDYIHVHLGELALYPKGFDAIKKLHENGVVLCLVSSSPRQLLEKGFEVHGLARYFASIVSGDDVTRHKPNPEAFLETISKLNFLPEEILIVGDAKTDIQAGKAAGLATCLFLPEDNRLFYDFEDFKQSKPDYLITSLEEIQNI